MEKERRMLTRSRTTRATTTTRTTRHETNDNVLNNNHTVTVFKKKKKKKKTNNKNNNNNDNNNNNKRQKLMIQKAEEKDLLDLRSLASDAEVLGFDVHGRPFLLSSPPRNNDDNDNDEKNSDQDTKNKEEEFHSLDRIDGLVRVAGISPGLFERLKRIHERIKSSVTVQNMVPWAGLDADPTRLRAFGFFGRERLDRLLAMGIQLHSYEKTGREADRDRKANHNAKCVLVNNNDDEGNDGGFANTTEKTVRDFVADCIKPEESGLPADLLTTNELVAFQSNLHNGAKHLAAHLDYPRHEGFGKVIVTVAIKGNATILLIGPYDEIAQEQPVWRFPLKEGDCYVLSKNARNRCLHAVLVDDDDDDDDTAATDNNNHDNKNKNRESLNLRFGLHTQQEADEEILQYWQDE